MLIKCNVKIVNLKFGQKVAITFRVTNIVGPPCTLTLIGGEATD